MSMPAPEWQYRRGRPHRLGRRYRLGELFYHSASQFPDRAALADGKCRYTFRELEFGARRVAAYLRARGVGKGDTVAVLADKIALIPILAGAIWKLGGIYAPLDAKNPPARTAQLLADLAPAAALGPAHALAHADGVPSCFEFSVLESVAHDAAAPALNRAIEIEESATAYIIYTSGSTGRPKGVMIDARGLLDYFFNHNQVLRFDASSRVFSLAPFHFDVSIEDTLLPLSLGAYVYQFGGVPVGPLIRSLLARERITHLIAVSTLLSIITEDGAAIAPERFPALSMVMTGAEVCDPKVINCWLEKMPSVRVINAYGPTEATIVCLTHEISRAELRRDNGYPIGRPLPGVTIRIVDASTEVTEPARTGELWIGGSQVMQGYLRQPAETTRVIASLGGERYYRSGDLCRYNAAGDVEFVGRHDDEVKLAGRRIHLCEIREIALTHPSVSRAAVGVVGAQSERHIAIVLIANNGAGAVEPVLALLRERLPDYMQPRVVAAANTVQLSSSGKTDEKELIRALARAYDETPAARYAMAKDGAFIHEEVKV